METWARSWESSEKGKGTRGGIVSPLGEAGFTQGLSETRGTIYVLVVSNF